MAIPEGKKRVFVTLRDDTIDKLEYLRKAYHVYTKSDVMDKLIKDAYDLDKAFPKKQ